MGWRGIGGGGNLEGAITLSCRTSRRGSRVSDNDSIAGTTRFNSTSPDIDQLVFMTFWLKFTTARRSQFHSSLSRLSTSNLRAAILTPPSVASKAIRPRSLHEDYPTCTSMSTTSTDTTFLNPPEATFTSSLDSLPRSALWSNKQLSKDYDLAQRYFSSKQFGEAYHILEPLISLPKSKARQSDDDEEHSQTSLIAEAKSSLRVKVWVLYFKLLDALIALGRSEGAAEFGRDNWRRFTSKVLDSTIWEQVLGDGYIGCFANVEAEVVWHLSVDDTRTLAVNAYTRFSGASWSSYTPLPRKRISGIWSPTSLPRIIRA